MTCLLCCLITAFTKAVTEEAVERGAFGAPTMFLHEDGENEEMFWGSDIFIFSLVLESNRLYRFIYCIRLNT